MLVGFQDFQPFDILPNELVVKIFAFALASTGSAGETSAKHDGGKPPSRRLLSHVCRRWKDVLQTHVCIGVPQIYCLALSKDTLESGVLISRIYSIAKFAGPVELDVMFSMDFKKSDWKDETPALLSSFAVALGAPHCATIILHLFFFPLEVLEFLITGSGCETFARITSLSLSQRPHYSMERAAAFTLHPITPQFPLLSHLSLLDIGTKPQLSLRSKLWSWLFQPPICADLLSLSVNPIYPEDLSWLLLRMPRLLDLRVSDTDDAIPSSDTQPLITHENVKQLSLGFGYSSSFIRCPKLTDLMSPSERGVDGRRTSLNWDPKVNLTTLRHRFTGSVKTDLAAYGLDLSSLTHLYIISISDSNFAEITDIIGRGFLPTLSHLSLRLSGLMSRGGFSTTPSSILPLALAANHLHQLTRPRVGHPGPHTIDCRIIEKYDSTTSALFHMVSLLRQAAHRDSVVLDPDAHFDQFTDPYDDLISIKALLDFQRSKGHPRDVAEVWTGLLEGMEKRIALNIPAYELLTAIPAFWDLFKQLKVMFIGTPFKLHEHMIYQWKVAGELTRQSWWTAKKQWRIGAAQHGVDWQFEGLYWGRQGDSLIYDLRDEDHFYFTEHNDLFFDHSVDGFSAGEPSPEVLRSLKLQS